MNLQIINPISYPEWDELLLSGEEYSFFHSSHWAKVLYESYHYNPLYFASIKDNNLEVAIPLMEVRSIFTGQRGVSLPFSDYCDPIISQGVDFRDVFNQIIEHGKLFGWKYITIKGGKYFLKSIPYSSYYYVYTLDLSQGKQQILSSLRDSTRRNIKKADREGVEVKISHSLKSISEFYRLNCITRRFHGLPPQPYYFFKKIYEHIIKKEVGLVVLASYKGKTIAGAVYFHFGDRAIYKYGASDRRYQYLRPNNLVMWKAIKWYLMNRFRRFSFGRTEPNTKGQKQFKTGWETSETIIKYYAYDLRKGDFITKKPLVSGIHNNVFRVMPIPLLKFAGSLLYKHMG